MGPVPDLRRYELFGFDYDARNPTDRRAVAWYLRHAGEAGGPVLEVACGGGSLLVPLARAGHEVTGLDLSAAMLDRARARRDAEPEEVRGRIALVQGDMSRFDLGRTFPTVILADNSFRELETRELLAACLRCLRRHVAPGGRLLLTEARFFPERFAGGPREWPFGDEVEEPRTGVRVSRRVRVRYDPEGRRVLGGMTYRVREPGGAVRTVECPFTAPVLTPGEYREMLGAAGFAFRLCVGYEERGDDGVDAHLCFVATPR